MHKVTLRRLEVLLAVVDEGGFAAAADRLGISQPSVSAHVKALERAVRGPVFERRTGRRPLLTDLGHIVLDHARQMLAEAADLDAVVLRSGGTAARVVFSCQRSLANFVFKDALTRFALDNRDIELVIRIGKQEEVAAELRDGVADLGCFLGNETPHGLSGTVIGHQRLVMVAAPDHPLAGRRQVTAGELAAEGFVGPPPSSHFGRSLYRLLAVVGIPAPRVVAQSTEYAFLRELVAAGVGISGSPESSVAADIASGRLARLALHPAPPAFDIRLVHVPQRALPPPALRLTAALRSVLSAPAAAD